MVHNIRIDKIAMPLNFELGSGLLDKNGREIFEGDDVMISDFIYKVEYKDGALCINDSPINFYDLKRLTVLDRRTQ